MISRRSRPCCCWKRELPGCPTSWLKMPCRPVRSCRCCRSGGRRTGEPSISCTPAANTVYRKSRHSSRRRWSWCGGTAEPFRLRPPLPFAAGTPSAAVATGAPERLQQQPRELRPLPRLLVLEIHERLTTARGFLLDRPRPLFDIPWRVALVAQPEVAVIGGHLERR